MTLYNVIDSITLRPCSFSLFILRPVWCRFMNWSRCWRSACIMSVYVVIYNLSGPLLENLVHWFQIGDGRLKHGRNDCLDCVFECFYELGVCPIDGL
jgi:hypothetical protein